MGFGLFGGFFWFFFVWLGFFVFGVLFDITALPDSDTNSVKAI